MNSEIASPGPALTANLAPIVRRGLLIILAVLLSGWFAPTAEALTRLPAVPTTNYDESAPVGDVVVGGGITLDTVEGSSQDPPSLHKYLYCTGDPINRIDPSGNESVIETLSVAALEVTTFAMRYYPYVKTACALWDGITIADITYKYMTHQQITTGEWVQFGAATTGVLLGPAAKSLARLGMAAKFGLFIDKSLRTAVGAEQAAGMFCKLERFEKPIDALTTGEFYLDRFGNPVIAYFKGADELRTAKTLIHEILHYFHWRLAGKAVGETYKTWAAAARAFEESTYAQFKLADGTKGFFSEVAEIILELTK